MFLFFMKFDIIFLDASMAELVDALDSKSGGLLVVSVRLRLLVVYFAFSRLSTNTSTNDAS